MDSNMKLVYMWLGVMTLVVMTVGVPLNGGEEIRELGKPNEEQSALKTFLGRKDSYPDNEKSDREKDSANLKRSVEKGNSKKKDGMALELTMYGEKPKDPRSQIVADSERRCWKVADGWRCLVTFDEDKDTRNW
ncbi:uncharacterized protein LOC108738433 isoform X2 [Agrilus planipennis]|uniref:Uncharacterized protein LOC108738433 isoform X2 n=1 Tax=Agrilus planipennis TaxID=224129 RepID=A0A7F5RBS1_AGRPL|nr:uncharacterized protein LOC108738433 isoform X2 [Agrilus planipennis]